jgi:D-alanyl-D-alanine carboxypeptidase
MLRACSANNWPFVRKPIRWNNSRGQEVPRLSMKIRSLRTVAATVSVLSLIITSNTPVFGAQSVKAQIDAITAQPALAGNTWSVIVENAAGNVTYYQQNPTLTQAPASNMKNITSGGAFALLGTTNFFVTTVYRNGTFSGGVVTGDVNLLVKHDITWNDDVFGTGNARAPLDFISTQLKNQGITKISGNVQIYGACMYNHADTDDTRDIANQATYNLEGATAFKAALQAQGITVTGSALGKSGFSAPGTLIYTYRSTNLTYKSSPLRLDIACIRMGKVSHNVMADLLMRHISYELTGNDDFTSGANKVLGWIKNSVGISTNDMVILDGSGLSHSDRVSAKEENAIDRYLVAHFPTWDDILPIGCYDGTLGTRFCGTDGANNVHAKTGSLSISIDLSGYVDNPNNGQRYFFSFLVNNASGIDQTTTRQAIDDAVNVIAGVTPTTVDSYAGNDVDGSMSLFLPDAVNKVEIDSQNGANGAFGGWSSLGGTTVSGAPPVVGYNGDQRLQLFVRGSDNNIWTATETAVNGGFGSWSSIGGNVRGTVTIGYLASGAMQLFARSSSNTVITTSQSGPNGTFGAWSDLGGQCYDDLVLAANADGRFQIFTRSSTDTVQSNFKTSSGTWFGWSDYGGSCIGQPQAAQLPDGSIEVFTRSSANTIKTIAQNGPNGSFGAWSDLGGTAGGDPAVSYNADGRMQLFVQTSTHTVASNFRTGTATNSPWFGWLDLGGSCYSDLTAGYNQDGRIQLLMRDNSYVMQSAWQTNVNSGFSGWFAFAGDTPDVSITVQPTSKTVTTGANAAFSVTAANALTYQWRLNSANISGATASSYTVVNAQTTDQGSYSVVVGNRAGSLTSADATLTVGTPPSITAQPQSVNVSQIGGSATFSVTATGSAPLTYQWYFEGAAISGATTSSYTDASVQTTDIGNYACVVNNSFGSATSSDASLTVGKLFFSDNLDANSSANWFIATNKSDSRATWAFDYSLRADKTGPGVPQNPFYTTSTKALKLEANISSGTAINIITLSPKTINVSGDFQLRFDAWHNFTGPAPGGGTGSTEFMSAGICSPGNVLTWPTNSLNSGVFVAQDSDGDVAAVNAVTPDYGVYTNRNATTAAQLVTTNTPCYAAVNGANPATFHGNAYYTNLSGATPPSIPTSETNSIMAGAANQTGQEAVGVFAFKWHEVILKKTGSGTGTTNISWYIDGFRIASVTNAYTPANGTNVSIGYFDAFGSVAATNFEFGLFSNFKVESFTGAGVAPTITSQPVNQTATAGATVTFSVAASSPTTLRYQWQKDGVKLVNGGNVSGATSSTLTLTSVAASDAAFYRCIVLNSSSYTISSTAGLTVGGVGPSFAMRPAAEPSIAPLRLTQAGTSVGSVAFQCSSIAGNAYQVQYTDDLASGNWTNLGDPIVADGEVITINDVSPSQTQRFYRVISIAH